MQKNNAAMLAVQFLLLYLWCMHREGLLQYLFGPLSLNSWTDVFPDSIREGRVGGLIHADLRDRGSRDAVVQSRSRVDHDLDAPSTSYNIITFAYRHILSFRWDGRSLLLGKVVQKPGP